MCVFEFKVPSSAGQQMRLQLQGSSDKLEKLGIELAIPILQALLHNNAFWRLWNIMYFQKYSKFNIKFSLIFSICRKIEKNVNIKK